MKVILPLELFTLCSHIKYKIFIINEGNFGQIFLIFSFLTNDINYIKIEITTPLEYFQEPF